MMPYTSVSPWLTALALAAILLFGQPAQAQQAQNTTVKLNTVLGEIEIQLLDSEAPRTVANFLSYVNSGAYNGSFIHRSSPGFVIQGGGYRWDATTSNAAAIPEGAAVANEFSTSRSNLRGTIAMARREGQVNSATNQWFINLADTNRLLDSRDGGFTVFGRVTDAGMRVADAISRLPIINLGDVFAELPIATAVGSAVTRANLVMVETAAVGQATPINYQGLWWNSAESGWGLSITQKGTTIFGAAYTFDANGRPAWYVMTCPVSNAVCTGQLYRVSGGTAPTVAWGGTNTPELVGNATLTFQDSRNARFQFTINGLAGVKNLTPLSIATSGTTPQTDFTDMWWNANESGWGVSITQQFTTIFAAWYTYDVNRQPIWYVAPFCVLTTSACSSRLFRVTGGSALTSVWAPSLNSVDIGSVTFAFTGSGTATMNYTIDGTAGSRNITRLPF
jgi:cyclophilin family peptidyl-prolyl cis-trans isomerase